MSQIYSMYFGVSNGRFAARFNWPVFKHNEQGRIVSARNILLYLLIGYSLQEEWRIYKFVFGE